LEAFQEVRRSHPDAFLVLAPRHPDRSDGVHLKATAAGLDLYRLSHGNSTAAGASDGLLVDTLGELSALYSLATAAFVGGSLIPVGGHNVLEPAAAGVPVLFGPHTEHFKEPAQALLLAGGASVVTGAETLARAWGSFLAEPELAQTAGVAAGRVVETNRGALSRSVELILAALDPGAGS
jgi:3-deoxy-D-manno-octulosonic-acid transferase